MLIFFYFWTFAMRFDLNNSHLEVEPVYESIFIRIRDSKVTDEQVITQIENGVTEIVEQSPGKLIILDFAKVKFMSSSFLGSLVKMQKLMQQCKCQFKLSNMDESIYKVFKITKLNKLFTIEIRK